MNKRVLFLSVIFISVAGSLVSQQAMPAFVSRLSAAVDGPTVRLTWKDSAETVSSYFIYRHDREITADTIETAVKIGEVEPGTMVFTDSPPDVTPYFYIVLAADEDGNAYRVYVPFRNKTTTSVAVDAESLEAIRPVSITNLRARVVGEQVALTYDTTRSKRDITVYRGAQPIFNTKDLLNAIPLATISSTQTEYFDSPVAGLDYYYAIFDTELLRTGSHDFIRSENVLVSSIRVPNSLASATSTDGSTIRSRPLPFLLLSAKLETGEQLSGVRNTLETPAMPLSDEIISQLETLHPGTEPTQPMYTDTVFLPGDVASSSSDSTELSRIVAPLFSTQSWDTARDELDTYLQTRRTGEEVSRARFYLGQAYYFDRMYRDAFIQFLYASEQFYADSRPWMDNVLALLRDTE